MVRIYLGTSGWSYEDWVGIFYKRSEGKLRYYTRIFNTVEMDSSFYKLPDLKTIERLSRILPSYFKMSLKLPNVITHKRLLGKLGSIEEDLNKFITVLNPLWKRDKLGAILIQLPPGLEYDIDLLKSFISLLDPKYRYAIEFRHISWLKREVFSVLSEYNIAYTIVDEPLLPPITEVTSDFTYIRWHGKGVRPWYNYWYRDDELKSWVSRIRELVDKVKTIYGYFNNHFRAYAVENCLKLMQMLGILNDEGRKILEEVRRNILSPREVIKYPEVKPEELKNKSILELLLMLSDKERIKRGVKIRRDEVLINQLEPSIQAKVRDYTLIVDPEERILMHDCADWNRVAPKKLLCKHFIKLFTLIPRDHARKILEDILLNRSIWSFQPYTE